MNLPDSDQPYPDPSADIEEEKAQRATKLERPMVRSKLNLTRFATVEGPKKRGPKRKLLSADDINDLEQLALIGCTREEQAAYLEISVETLYDRIRDQQGVFEAPARGGARMHRSLRSKQMAVALNDKHPAQATMLIWLGKAVLGQSEKVHLNIQSTADAIARLKEAWPEIAEGDLIKQLLGASEVIDVDAEEVGGEAQNPAETLDEKESA